MADAGAGNAPSITYSPRGVGQRRLPQAAQTRRGPHHRPPADRRPARLRRAHKDRRRVSLTAHTHRVTGLRPPRTCTQRRPPAALARRPRASALSCLRTSDRAIASTPAPSSSPRLRPTFDLNPPPTGPMRAAPYELSHRWSGQIQSVPGWYQPGGFDHQHRGPPWRLRAMHHASGHCVSLVAPEAGLRAGERLCRGRQWAARIPPRQFSERRTGTSTPTLDRLLTVISVRRQRPRPSCRSSDLRCGAERRQDLMTRRASDGVRGGRSASATV